MFWKSAISLTFFVCCFGSYEGKRSRPPVNYGLCQIDQYRCLNEKCIRRSWFCDGKNDCGDNSDEHEQYCNPHYRGYNCPTHYPFFKCQNRQRCIPKVWQCDGVVDCSDKSDEVNCLDAIEQITGSLKARQHAAQWMVSQKRNITGGNKWGFYAPRIAVALYLSDQRYFDGHNTTGNELAYEIDIQLLVSMLRDAQEPTSMNKLALYIHALLVTCMNPRDFFGLNLVTKLRQLVDDQTNYSSPYVLLALCNAKDKMTSSDVKKLVYAFERKERPFWTDTQALALIALSCIHRLPDGPFVNASQISTMSSELQKRQSQDGQFENLHTTAVVMQALFAAGKDDDDWDMDEAVKYLVTNQSADGSYGSLLNTYFVLPVLHYKSLLNISSSHCTNRSVDNEDEANALDDLSNKIGNKIFIKYSIWFGDKVDLARSLQLRVLENSSFFDVMTLAKSLDERYDFKYNMLSSKPYTYALAGYQDDPENEKFWFLHKVHSSGLAEESISLSPVDVIPKDKDEYTMWYHTGHWTEDVRMRLLDKETDKQNLTTEAQMEINSSNHLNVSDITMIN